jgi:hypothetical protein
MLGIISHDAGGAEILSSYVRRNGFECCYAIEGPALKVFERKLGKVKTCDLEDAICKSESILCGTSWQSDLEFNAIKQARSLGKRSIAFLDHWVNYRERFTRSGETFLPNGIWVGDAMAEVMAKKLFPDTTISLVENPYVNDIRQELAAIQVQPVTSSDGIVVLYVCEPVREHALLRFDNERHWGYVEEEALRYFLTKIAILGRPINRVLIRPHPSEPIDKYNWAQHEFNLPIEMGGNRTLIEEIAESDVVVGCESMAMIVGLVAGKRVISCIPPEGKTCGLPHREIENLHKLLKTNTTISESKEHHEYNE